MSVTEFLTFATRTSFLLLGVLTFIDYLRHQDETRLDIFLVFASLAISITGTYVRQLTGLELPWVGMLGTMAILAHPYLFLRLLTHFRPLPYKVNYPAIGGLVIAWAMVISFPPPRPIAVTLALVIYFVTVQTYAAVAFVQSAWVSGGVTRRRLILIAGGVGLLALAILLAGINQVLPGPNSVIATLTQALAILSAFCYYLGFATPYRIRKAWQLSELYDYLHQTPVLSAQRQVTAMLDHLCQAATKAVGGEGAVVVLWDDDEEQLTIRGKHGPLVDVAGSFSINNRDIKDGAIERAWRNRQPVYVQKLSEFGPEATLLATRLEATALFVLPIATRNRVWGLLLVFLRRNSLFVAEDTHLLALFTEQSAVALNYASLLAAERVLIEKLNYNNAQLQATTQELEAFAYSVSHDLRAPLRALDGFSEALIQEYKDEMDDTGRHYLQRIRAASGHMAQLIDDLLNLSRVTRSEMQPERVDLTAMAQEVVSDRQQREAQCPATFTISENMCIEGDGRLLRLLLENLIDNACKFSSTQPDPQIEIGTFQEADGGHIFFVKDNGVGFDMAYADKLFGAFQRLHGATEFPGTGIGLATVQRIVHRHGGRIWAEAAVGKGATFYFGLEQENVNSARRSSLTK